MEKGKTEVRDAAMLDVAKSLLAFGIPIEQIAHIAGVAT